MIKGRVTETVTRRLDKIVKGLHFGGPLRESQEILMDEIQRNFADQGRTYQLGALDLPGSTPNRYRSTWQPLTERTQAQREELGYSPKRPILIRKGTLKNSFIKKSPGRTSAEIYSTSSIAKYHQDGTKHMNQRKIIGVTKKSFYAIKQTFVNYFNRLLTR